MKRNVVVFLSAVCMIMFACSSAQKKSLMWSYRALHWTKLAGEGVDSCIAAWASANHLKCKTVHQSKTSEFNECIKSTIALLQKWTGCKNASDPKTCSGGILPTLQASQKTALNTLEAIYKGGVKSNPVSALIPAVCSLVGFVSVAEKAGVDFGKAKEAIKQLLDMSQLICK